MLKADSSLHFNLDNIKLGTDDALNNDIISEIERELQDNPYDMISLVFLLYDVPDTALQRLLVFERISKGIGTSTNLNMLHEWYRCSKHSSTWKHEFIEALLLCQLNSILRKLGFDVSSTKKFYDLDNVHIRSYINPIKRALYRLCENMSASNLDKLKRTLLTYDIDTASYDSCELVLLKLMCEKFITVSPFPSNIKLMDVQADLSKLIKIIENLPGLKKFGQELNRLQQSINSSTQFNTTSGEVMSSTPIKVDDTNKNITCLPLHSQDLQEVFDMLGDLALDDNISSLKSDSKKLGDDCYEIKNPNRVGVCVILNQMDFYPSKNSIESNQPVSLSTRTGSDKDKEALERTMSALNFSVYSADNLNHTLMFDFLKQVIKTKVTPEDSVFVLCILSHGVKGHVYAADSVKVKMDDFQNLLDSDIAVNLHGKPKLLIVQACQVVDTPSRLVADGPGDDYSLKKTNFLICWATAPELEAFRDEEDGSIFIQILCHTLQKFANVEHIGDIFLKVTDKVTEICEKKLHRAQVPISHSTFRKKLYLKMRQ